ncbi:unnamed protein product [Adineta steineri]|uniref:Uncharacterized protein n=1 Tax=Adineta steineri TaxID=433720 RepID=A0A815H1U3_9BILA|nr:unnamed protein product [Adineta steineri]CAF4077470.1 unnamed protein product [Adineta steineri]
MIRQTLLNTSDQFAVPACVGVFAGYLGYDNLTATALIEIDDELFYRPGDLVHMNDNGLLHYHGRKDHQVKLRGQRTELD